MVDTVKTGLVVCLLLLPVAAVADTQPSGTSDNRWDGGGDLERMIVSFETQADVQGFLQSLPVSVVFQAQSVPALVVDVPGRLADGLAHMPGVLEVQEDRPVPLHLETSTKAMRAKAVWGDFLGGPILHPETGEVIDGSGIGVAVIDTGVDATHPDLADRVAKNILIVSPSSFVGPEPYVYVENENTDEQGHGTHVSGTVAGTGVSVGGHRGVAPGAAVYGLSANVGIHLWHQLAAWDWILENHDKVDPPIRVVNNSYGCGGNTYHEDALDNRLRNMAIDEGIVVVHSSGNGDLVTNDGGDGSDDRTGGCSNNPRVLGVANYDDGGTGTRDGELAPSSSRGLATDPSTWPDISAPGSDITAAMATTDGVGWLTFGPLVDQTGNPFGNAVNQWWGSVGFVLDGAPSTPGQYNYNTMPVVTYNAHEDTWTTGSEGSPSFDPGTDPRFYRDVSDPIGPVHPLGSAGYHVSPGDRIVFEKDLGTAQMPVFRVVSPSGVEYETYVHFPCERECSAQIDLFEHFPGEPADGTWTITMGKTVRDEPEFYSSKTGTSMSAPHVAGAAALILQVDPSLTPKDVMDIMQTTAYRFDFGADYEPLPHMPYVNSSFDKGAGLIDARAAVLAAVGWEPIPGDGGEGEGPDEPVEPIRTYKAEGHSIVDSWPHTAPSGMEFEVRADDRLVLAEMRWNGTLGQGVDLVLLEPKYCSSIPCLAEYWVLKEHEDGHRAEGDRFPSEGGALRILIEQKAIEDAGCGEFLCTWQAQPLPTLAVDIDYDVRVTVLNDGELPEGYSAFS